MALAEQVAQLSDADLYNAAVIQTLEDYVTEQASRRRRVVSAAQFSAARAKIRDPLPSALSHTRHPRTLPSSPRRSRRARMTLARTAASCVSTS
jgi:hypothetical protein